LAGSEFFGGLLIVIGLCTRPVAFILAGMMAVALPVPRAALVLPKHQSGVRDPVLLPFSI
jgi:hypothetical protein